MSPRSARPATRSKTMSATACSASATWAAASTRCWRCATRSRAASGSARRWSSPALPSMASRRRIFTGWCATPPKPVPPCANCASATSISSRSTARPRARPFTACATRRAPSGSTFAGHVPLAIDWIEAADAGMRTIEHVQTILENEVEQGVEPLRAVPEAMDRVEGARGDAIFAALARNGTFWDPTLVAYEASWRDDPPERRALKQRLYARMRPLVGRAFRAGRPDPRRHRPARSGAGKACSTSSTGSSRPASRRGRRSPPPPINPHGLVGRGPGPIRPGGEASLIVVDGRPARRYRQCPAASA